MQTPWARIAEAYYVIYATVAAGRRYKRRQFSRASKSLKYKSETQSYGKGEDRVMRTEASSLVVWALFFFFNLSRHKVLPPRVTTITCLIANWVSNCLVLGVSVKDIIADGD